jgi:hypothetical protein
MPIVTVVPPPVNCVNVVRFARKSFSNYLQGVSALTEIPLEDFELDDSSNTVENMRIGYIVPWFAVSILPRPRTKKIFGIFTINSLSHFGIRLTATKQNIRIRIYDTRFQTMDVLAILRTWAVQLSQKFDLDVKILLRNDEDDVADDD